MGESQNNQAKLKKLAKKKVLTESFYSYMKSNAN